MARVWGISSCILSFFVICLPLLAQDKEASSATIGYTNGNADFEELQIKIDGLQTQIDSLIDTTQNYARENQSLRNENTQLQNELSSLNAELNQAKSEANETMRRFDSSAVEMDQRSWFIGDLNRRKADCEDNPYAIGEWECTHQTNNLNSLTREVQSR